MPHEVIASQHFTCKLFQWGMQMIHFGKGEQWYSYKLLCTRHFLAFNCILLCSNNDLIWVRYKRHAQGLVVLIIIIMKMMKEVTFSKSETITRSNAGWLSVQVTIRYRLWQHVEVAFHFLLIAGYDEQSHTPIYCAVIQCTCLPAGRHTRSLQHLVCE